MADLQRQCHQSMKVVVGWRCLLPLSIHMLYDDTVTWRVWAAKKSSSATAALRSGFKPKARGRSLRQKTEAGSRLRADAEWAAWTASCLPCVCIASYQGKFQLRGPMVLRNRELHARNDDEYNNNSYSSFIYYQNFNWDKNEKLKHSICLKYLTGQDEVLEFSYIIQ